MAKHPSLCLINFTTSSPSNFVNSPSAVFIGPTVVLIIFLSRLLNFSLFSSSFINDLYIFSSIALEIMHCLVSVKSYAFCSSSFICISVSVSVFPGIYLHSQIPFLATLPL